MWVGVAKALAAGFMIAASALLFYEGARACLSLIAVPAFLFVAFFDGLVPLGLGLAGGAMLWMARWSPTRSRRARGGPWRSHLSGSTAAMLTLEALLLT